MSLVYKLVSCHWPFGMWGTDDCWNVKHCNGPARPESEKLISLAWSRTIWRRISCLAWCSLCPSSLVSCPVPPPHHSCFVNEAYLVGLFDDTNLFLNLPCALRVHILENILIIKTALILCCVDPRWKERDVSIMANVHIWSVHTAHLMRLNQIVECDVK